MEYTIELTIDLRKNPNITEIKQTLSDLAEKYNAISNYFMHEIEGHSVTIDRNDCIHTITFSSDNTTNLIKYIKIVNKLKFAKIDCIYQDNGQTNIIYASKKYLVRKKIHPKISPKLNTKIPPVYNEILELIK